MLTSDFDYHLPEELIASRPPESRADSRMMVVDRASGRIEHRRFADFADTIRTDDRVVLNNTRVVPARFLTEDGKRELLRLESRSPIEWRCMVRPGRKFRLGDQVTLGQAVGEVTHIHENGDRDLRWSEPVDEDRFGHLALPHYMKREDDGADKERYQTVYARHEGSIAAPTAGLHFTPEILADLPHSFVTLHVGVGTFQPVRVDRVEDHTMHAERYQIDAGTAEAIESAERVIAVGTTTLRTLESVARENDGRIIPCEGSTDIFIYPGFEFRAVDALLTNFHLPKSTLLMLVSAFAGKDLMLEAYRKAVEERYRFFSYGDCMLIQ